MNRTSFLSLFIISILTWGCTEVQDFSKPATNYDANKWIEQTMREEYYWSDEIPEKSELNYNMDAEDFFNSLLSKKDGKIRNGVHDPYSKINQKSDAATKSYIGDKVSLGFEYLFYDIRYQNGNRYALRVLYVLPNSPASGKDIKRGDFVFEINNQLVTDELVKQIKNGGEFKLGISETMDPRVTKTVTLTAAKVEDDPVYLHKTFNINGKNIAYLVYNHFTAGSNDKDETFNDSLRKAFTEFKEANSDEVILDLRFNGGGLVRTAQLMATMLAPASALEDVFCKLSYKNKKRPDDVFALSSSFMNQGAGGKNLDTKRLFVITSRFTASASEAVINGLKPYLQDNLIIIGEKTEGKNVGSNHFENERYEWALQPIICLVSNKDGFSDYSNGFIPDAHCSEPDSGLFDLGDPKEYILSRVLAFIENGTPIESPTTRSADTNNTKMIPLGSSLDRKRTNGVIIDIER